MELDFLTNNYYENVVVFAQYDEDCAYYFSNKEFWIVEYWDSYVDLKTGKTLENAYYEFIQQFRIEKESISSKAKVLWDVGEEDAILINLPTFFVDFGRKVFLSRFSEQLFERRMIGTWEGEFVDFLSMIPNEFRYWEFSRHN
jgi:hypothetical protein